VIWTRELAALRAGDGRERRVSEDRSAPSKLLV